MMIPSNMLLSVFKPRIYIPTVVIIWGIVRYNFFSTHFDAPVADITQWR